MEHNNQWTPQNVKSELLKLMFFEELRSLGWSFGISGRILWATITLLGVSTVLCIV